MVQQVLGDPYSGNVLAPVFATAIRVGRHRERLWWDRVCRTIAVAEDHLGEPLEPAATADAASVELAARVLQAAGRTPLEQKIPALGRVLAYGLDASGRVDEALILAAALDDLEAPHVQVLKLLTQESPDEDPKNRGFGWLHDQAVAALPGYALVMAAVLSTLARHGLASELNTWGGVNRLAITDLGRRCLELLDGSADATPRVSRR